tara:strand:+ start:333 stop:476 length:144 start_codon:yes stop_codon:yes gene_type:complete
VKNKKTVKKHLLIEKLDKHIVDVEYFYSRLMEGLVKEIPISFLNCNE